jgi:hypothetical protein
LQAVQVHLGKETLGVRMLLMLPHLKAHTHQVVVAVLGQLVGRVQQQINRALAVRA